MLTIPSLLAAMTIAGAFWVGVLAARRLRDWGDGRRMLEEAEAPLALAAASGASVDDPASQKVRALVAERLQASLSRDRGHDELARRSLDALTLTRLRVSDVVMLETAEPGLDGDYLVEGVVTMREGPKTTVAVSMADGDRRRWLVGAEGEPEWLVVEPEHGHGLSGEPPRNIELDHENFTLERRGQATVAAIGRHGRPEGSRVGTYVYRSSGRRALWVERWGSDLRIGRGAVIEATTVSFLPGS